MTPHYRTAFSVPSGFAASTPSSSQPTASIGIAKARKPLVAGRPQVKAATEKAVAVSRKSAAA